MTNEYRFNVGVRDVSKWSERMRRPMEEVYGEEYFRTKWEEWVDAMTRLYNETGGVLYSHEELASIRCSTLIIHGKKDSMVGEEQAQHLQTHIQNSRYVLNRM